MTDYTVADLVADFLAQIGVETGFGIVSVHNIPLLDAINRRNRIRVVPTRGEAGGSHMADGYARAGNRLGVLITSTGPGAANACAGLVEARFAATPLLHITGQNMTHQIGRDMGPAHDVPDQIGMLAASGKAAFAVTSAEGALGTLIEAATAALTPPCGPVSVEIPIDLQRAKITRPESLETLALPIRQPPSVDDATMSKLIATAKSARRPILWLGNGAAAAGPAARRLLDMGFAAVTSWNGRATVPEDHPMSLGALNGGGVPMIEDFYGTCDLMIVAGSRQRAHETINNTVSLPERRIQIDIDPVADHRTYSNDLFVLGEVADALTRLADALETWKPDPWTPDPSFGPDFHRLKAAARRGFAATLGPYATFAEQLQSVMPRDAIWVRDVTVNHSTWGQRLLQLGEPTQSIYPVGAGIGQGFSLAVGAALADGRKTICMTGDGGFFLNLGELWTAVQEHTDMVILVMNDSGYGVIRHIQDATGAARSYESFAAPDLEGLAALAKLPFWRVSDPDHFGPTVAEALAITGPTLVEVDMNAIGHHPPYFPYGPKVEAVD
ncbi:MAG: thiamine pyrophosphate-binding protein [Pseudomonadota bacterium]